jgi:MobA/VirD2-like, nuclease domain
MILKASQRAGGTQLAIHLLKTDENEHVEIHEVSGFMGDTPMEAFNEAYAISRGTKCRQFLFSLSLSPPETESVPVDAFEQAIADIEKKISLIGQPRVIVFHEKEGRRHAHCVWSRIDVEKMRAINLPHFKLKLRDISRELYLEHGWQMPHGLVNSEERNPLNFTQAEWQQAKRIKQDPRAIKEAFQDCWAISDSKSAFACALEERGYYLAKGDRRGFVAIDWRGEVYAISRWVGVKAKDVKAKLGNPDELPSVEKTQQQLTGKFTDKLQKFVDDAFLTHDKAEQVIVKKRLSLAKQHRHQRAKLKKIHTKRWTQETKNRSALLPTGLKALWFRVTGKYRTIKKQNEMEAKRCKLRNQAERQNLIDQQLRERRQLQHDFRLLRHHHGIQIKKLNRDMGEYLKLSPDNQDNSLHQSKRRITRKRQI